FFTLSSLEKRLAETVVRGRDLIAVVAERGVERDCFSQGRDGQLVFVQRLVGLAQMEVWVGVVRLDAGSLLKEGYRRLPLALDGADDAEVVVGEELVRVRAQLDSELLRRVVESGRAVLQKVCESEVVVRAREVRVECDGAFELVDGRGQKAGLAVCATEEDVKLRAVAESAEQAFVNLLRGGEPLLLEVDEAERVADVVVVGREPERGLEFGGGAVELAEHEEGLAAHVASADALRVACERGVERRERLFELVRVEVSYRQIEQNVLRVGAVARGRFERRGGFLVPPLRGVDFAELRVAFGQYGRVFGLRRREVAGAPVALCRFVVSADRVLWRLEEGRQK